jgi:hypothetical protein
MRGWGKAPALVMLKTDREEDANERQSLPHTELSEAERNPQAPGGANDDSAGSALLEPPPRPSEDYAEPLRDSACESVDPLHEVEHLRRVIEHPEWLGTDPSQYRQGLRRQLLQHALRFPAERAETEGAIAVLDRRFGGG